ncbi:DNA-directed RNA polymerase subunit beta' [Mycoplasma phocoenae]|uniref:DNA-directed RNA polymerase subunit beta' n=1 Tax=Mycoplasma phocoenae TaxID=754517 RepID=A0A858U793_9MOLU|nr:DNA-directed RNA polymerase subunit beta' [Mycoplasma phocoenae]QJG67103.1 DNA-directed RNA polymerase subunit beta' [Mycoplasma phocoenae]
MPKTRKYASLDETRIDKISLALATSEEVSEWSHGEVTKPETINYKSYKPERFGLFDELIFGPMLDYRCPICGHKYKMINKNQYCIRTELCKQEKPEILPKIARRYHMGHIKLNSPVVHFWYFKVDHSILSKLLGLKVENTEEYVKRSSLENLIYYKSHIILESGGLKSLQKNRIIDINNAGIIYNDALLELREKMKDDEEALEDIEESLKNLVEKASSRIGQDHGIDFYEYNDIIEAYSDAKIGTGSKAIEYLLKNIDLEKEHKLVTNQINAINAEENALGNISTSAKTNREKLYKRLKVINSFIESGQKPTSMLIYNLPVIPADLRPLVQLDGGRHSTSDVNELYRRVIIRNNRLKNWQETAAPHLLEQNELRMIQEAVDALIDNARKSPNPVMSKDNRPFKSISDALSGKKGRFRQNLLGKRVDYSGRSVIVVGPNLKMHQCGIPREMAAKLFEPWIINCLINKEVATTIKNARKMIEDENPIIWPYVAEAIKGRLVLLNRAPTLHRLSIQAFEPVLVRGKAIRLHPLVCTAFNADFDGDQMAVHVPISEQALLEARELMLANKNILGPKDGEPIINPSQDMILGLYYLTMEKAGAKGDGRYFSSFDHMMRAYEDKRIDLHARVALPISAIKEWDNKYYNEGDKYIISSVGKFIFNSVFPTSFPFIHTGDKVSSEQEISKNMRNFIAKAHTDLSSFIKIEAPVQKAFTKKNIAKIIRLAFTRYVSVLSFGDVASVIKDITPENYKDTLTKYIQLKDYRGHTLDIVHANALRKFTIEEFELNYNSNKIVKPGESCENVNAEEKAKILDGVWFKYTNIVASILDKVKALGFKYSTLSGISISIDDIIGTDKKSDYVKEGDDYIAKLKEYYTSGELTDDDRYNLTIKKWTEVKDNIQKELKTVIESNPNNPVIVMIDSGARGTINNYVQLAGMRGLMANNTKTLKADAKNDRVVRSTVEVPVKSSFLEGLTAYEFYSSTHGARKGLTDTALNTAKSGYLTRRLVDVAQNIVVKEENCGSDYGFVINDIVDNKTQQKIVSMVERIEGRFTNKNIDLNGEIIKRGTLITPEIASRIADAGVKQVEIRSIFGCNTKNGVCKYCFGKDLATNRLVNIGEAVGIIAAQSIGEPGTQLTMRTFHSGGVAGVEDITGGFTRLIELIDAYDTPWGTPATISPFDGVIVDTHESAVEEGLHIVTIEYKNSDKQISRQEVEVRTKRKLRVKVGDQVKRGQRLSEGPIILKDLLEIADVNAVQNYLLKEIQRIYRSQGIAISDKYIEIIVRQMMSKVTIYEQGDSKFFAGEIVDIFEYQEECGKLLSEGKKPAFGKVIIKGAKQTPLLSDSFLAAASYQETTKILVHAAISNKFDYLEGLKENIILGKKIPAGTNFAGIEKDAKYDIKSALSYFKTEDPVDIDFDFDEELAQYEEEIKEITDEIQEESQEVKYFEDSSEFED